MLVEGGGRKDLIYISQEQDPAIGTTTCHYQRADRRDRVAGDPMVSPTIANRSVFAINNKQHHKYDRYHSPSKITNFKIQNCQRAISCQGWLTGECMMEASDCAKIYDLSGEATVCNVMVVRALPPPFPMQCSVSVNGSTTAIWAHNYHVPEMCPKKYR
ncbi:hypothetical protein CEXT_211231 [Caerostris extrusa]|uniref:Uncharacterized protein n=1 Tax=Caerostris extrusa TaxID=172846 RepID=A0AAV4NBA7_CAEEX|nr:hypothetical protein CEXT_211231 [Caerostris extrusa]